MPEIRKRQIAYKIRIKDILEGKYVKEEGWNPNYIVTANEKEVSRVNIIGIVIDKQFEFNKYVLIIDDSSGKIFVRTFNDNKIIDKINIGEVILIIGRPREYNNEKFIMPEIIKKIDNKKWIDFRRLELKPVILKREIKYEKISNPSEKIFKLIKELDNGEGANFNDIVNKSNIKDSEKIIKILLSEGEIFQNSPGKLKVLE